MHFHLKCIKYHIINLLHFPFQLQLFGFNSDLYANVSEALELRESSALVAISILVQLAETPSPELRVLTSPLRKIVYRGMFLQIRCTQ